MKLNILQVMGPKNWETQWKGIKKDKKDDLISRFFLKLIFFISFVIRFFIIVFNVI